ncbi:hypothetical protein DPMN_019661 [Dreissena polymorpha]|uniref:Uncharacterized protein n=1 Tax=Dreissena polymorpha TaxID=45954 RepID=A0A9D4NJP4_DREPO|nr:hypothetical protein DPMN_019661 [Dreissena polymorpha]
MKTLGKPELFENQTIRPVPRPFGLQRVYCTKLTIQNMLGNLLISRAPHNGCQRLAAETQKWVWRVELIESRHDELAMTIPQLKIVLLMWFYCAKCRNDQDI